MDGVSGHVSWCSHAIQGIVWYALFSIKCTYSLFKERKDSSYFPCTILFQINHRYYTSEIFVDGRRYWRKIEGNPNTKNQAVRSVHFFQKQVSIYSWSQLKKWRRNVEKMKLRFFCRIWLLAVNHNVQYLLLQLGTDKVLLSISLNFISRMLSLFREHIRVT